ncbi:hypothetical protein [Paenibacillus qinlingensis]|uniref:Aspartate kinase n=1 Tax=Paenibacillus qinlingensis TaxID=1837343 RepID=A0ABU1NZZ3_9BACL|nr:hypothetical protein [Paenibacillus qinlingensis]MDR6552412.1 hypothetical protein [Paenibacillus qinlingensis]
MQNLISQLKNIKLKELHTLDYSTSKYSNVEIISAENGILNFTSNGVEHFVPMHLIAGVEVWSGDYDSKILTETDNSDSGESSGMVGLFNSLVGKAKIDFSTLAEQLNDISNAAVIGLNEEIVVLSTRDTVYAVALRCISEVSNVKKT